MYPGHMGWVLYSSRGCYSQSPWYQQPYSEMRGLWVSKFLLSFLQFSSVAQSYLTLCDPMSRSMPGLPVQHQLPESTQTHVHRVDDAIQPSYPLLPPSPLPSIFPSIRVFQMSQLFASGGQRIGVSALASVLLMSIQD